MSFAALAAGASLGGCAGEPRAPENPTTNFENHEQFFPIASGAHNMMNCNECHGQFDTFTQFSCIGCHDHSQQVTDPQHSNVGDYIYNETSCFTCHPDGTAAGVDHSLFFPIDAASTHADQNCMDCHIDPNDRKVFSCVSCHEHSQEIMDPAHSGVTEYVFASPNCLSCHPDGLALDRLTHDQYFPISAMTEHAETTCEECHPSADRTQFRCFPCHAHEQAEMAQEHTAVGDYEYQSLLCARCHIDSKVFEVEDHTPFRIDGNSNHGPDDAGCIRCHTMVVQSRPIFADFNQFNCLDCHPLNDIQGDHDEEPNFRFESTSCVLSGCHPTGESDD